MARLWGSTPTPPPSRLPSLPSLPTLPSLPSLPSLPPGIQSRILEHKWYIAGGAATLGTIALLNSLRTPNKPKPIPSVQECLLPNMAPEDLMGLPYPPNALPGARDVDTPYGIMRVYEWGPEKGDRVLLIHGISTPSPALAGVADKLVKKGCRVMLFDLFGRGYSATPDPKATNYDSALYTTQILLCLQSSILPWSSYIILGYSLGGAVAADFASYFPHHVKGLVLVAPGGLMRKEHIPTSSKILYSTSGLVPQWLLHKLVARRLYNGPEVARTMDSDAVSIRGDDESDQRSMRSVSSAVSASLLTPSSSTSRTASDIVDWQIANHPGFVKAFVSTIRYAPTHEQQDRWKIIGQNMRDRYNMPEKERVGLKEVWLVLGEIDPIIIADEIVEDAKDVLGRRFVKVKILDGVGHDVPMVRPDEVARVVLKILGHKK
ncbi:alpha/beta-hydrolase [Pleomassaria siparia CBS 279.74]|uniref:Alpha/beta-hydrolase n=1 Tax=Pleomassaria siparia CBS 279.74 TaxID=1314801 RepID=A0A6G1JTP5_9PLEO|nr:alpha/beta-hydrolase [Pleomassaria siparia CBS 279.74]